MDSTIELNTIKIKDYEVVKFLGNGVNGFVIMVKNSGGTFAAKMCDKMCDKIADFIREIDMTCRIDHKNFVKVVDVVVGTFKGKKIFFMIEELGTQIGNKINLMGSRDKMKIIFDIASASHYMHKNGIIHGDVKIDNIIYTESGECKLIDVGISAYKNEVIIGEFNSFCSRAPEYLITDIENDFSFVDDNCQKNVGDLTEIIKPEYVENKTFIKGELWSFAFCAIDIIIGKEFFLSDLNVDSDCFPIILEKNKSLYIRQKSAEMFPTEDETTDLFYLITGKLLRVNPDERFDDFEQFLTSKVFSDRGFYYNEKSYEMREYKRPKTEILPSGRDIFIKSISWVIEVCIEYNVSSRAAFLAIDNVRGMWTTYTSMRDKKLIQSFLLAAMYVSFSSLGYIIFEDDISNTPFFHISNGGAEDSYVRSLVERIIVDQKGMIGRKTIYDYASCGNILIMYLDRMKETVRDEAIFYTCETKEVSDILIKNIEEEGTDRFIAKTYTPFQYLVGESEFYNLVGESDF